MKLVDKTNGKVVAQEVEVADKFWPKFRGLMLRRKFKSGEAILFKFKKPGRYSIHMFFVRFPIDLVYLDISLKFVEIHKGIKPWRFYRPKSASSYLVELPAGVVDAFNIKIGHVFRLAQ